MEVKTLKLVDHYNKHQTMDILSLAIQSHMVTEVMMHIY